jgi:hypothetical protein
MFQVCIGTVIMVTPVIVLFVGLCKYIRRKREDNNIRFSDILVKLLFIGLYGASFVITISVTTNDGGKEFYVPIDPINDHYIPFSGRHLFSLIVYDLLCAFSVAIVCFKWRELPPLALSLCIIFFIIGIIVNGFAIAQYGNVMRANNFEPLFGVFGRSLNTALLITLLITVVRRERQEALNRQYKNNFLNKINAIIGARYFLWAFILLIPVFIIITLILLLFGQEYDSMVKVWTETATWAFSQREHPPYLEHHGHYLCTVAACGHPRVVKPLRLGLRHGKTIIVNRQLMVANAFEDMIKRRFRRTHGVIRLIYDKCGYPVSKHIANKYMSDVVYFLMKPLEFFFLITLYLFELKPEEVIKRQYAK